MKTSYSSTIKTRNVAKIVNQVKNIVKGYDGRIDNIRSGEYSGHVSFILPKNKFEEFRAEINNITFAKLYSEIVHSTNLLSEKIGIENRTESSQSKLQSLNEESNRLDISHKDAINQLNNQIYRLKEHIQVVQSLVRDASTSTSQAVIDEWKRQGVVAQEEINELNKQIIAENSSYNLNKKTD